MSQRRFSPAAGVLVAAAGLSVAAPAPAQWSTDPQSNLALADRPGDQVQPLIRATADGGCYVSWFDNSSGGYDVYLQRLDRLGVEQWAHDGVLVADRSFSSTQAYGMDVHVDGSAVLTFRDDRSGGVQITAAKIDPSGMPAWGPGGVQLTNDAAFHAAPGIAATTDGGVVVGWTNDNDVKLQRLDAAGVPSWGPGVVLADTAGGRFSLSDIHGSDAGNVILSWNREQDFNAPKHIYAQKLSGGGAALWGTTPVVVFDGGSLQFGNFPRFVVDADGSAVFGWYTNSPSLQCRAQRILASGSEAFPHDGVAASTNAAQLRVSPSVAFLPANGETLLFWTELSLGQSQWGISGQKFATDGTREWTDQGRTLVPLDGTERGLVRTLPFADGALVLFADKPSPPSGERILGTRVDGDGQFVWTTPVHEVSSALASKSRLDVTLSAHNVALLAWSDRRSGNEDVYVQNLNGNGALGLRRTDINLDGFVDVLDLLDLLAAWGPCPPGSCPPDVNGDGVVNVIDLLEVLSDWG